MAHAEKYTRGQCPNMFKHYDRTMKNDKKNIDSSLTHLNYNLAPSRNMTQYQFMKNRIGEVKHIKRKDINTMVDIVLTKPKDLPEEETDIFFEKAYQFLVDRYGEENVISAYVHMDEPDSEPHMHFSFVPVATIDGVERLNAKKVISRMELKKFHPDLKKFLEKELGHEVGVLNDATAGGNKTIEELKAETLIKQNEELEKDNRLKKGINNQVEDDLRNMESHYISERDEMIVNLEQSRSFLMVPFGFFVSQ